METIISYIDNIFRNYPDTSQVRRARKELLDIMEDKYHELKSDGKSENEAIGIVISEFGSMDEIAAALCAEQEILPKKDTEAAGTHQNENRLTLEQAIDYIKIQEHFGIKVGIGVALCILSPTMACITSALQDAGFFTSRLADSFAAIVLFSMVAIAVGIFITSGFAVSKYEDYKKHRIILDESAKKEITDQQETYRTIFSAKITAGVILCIVSIIPIVLADAIFADTSFFWISEIFVICLLGFVAIGVFLFITAGIKQSAYEVLLETGPQYSKKVEKEKSDRLIQMIASVYWPVITVIYLIWSFATMSWGFTWIIWPVSGIIFGAISATISLIQKAK